MRLLTKKEAEQLLKQASSVVQLPTTAAAIQAALATNKGVTVLLLKA